MIRHQLLRIAANYTRLIISFIAGIVIVRQLLVYGEDIFNIYTVVTIGAGIGIMLKEMLRIALVPLLAEHWQKNDTEFSRHYVVAFGVSSVVASIGFVIMVVFAFSMHHFSIQPENLFAAQVFVICRAIVMVMSVCLAPLIAMQAVSQRFVQVNLLILLERCFDVLALFMPLFFLGEAVAGSQALIIFAVASVIFAVFLYGIFTVYLTRVENRLWPRWSFSKLWNYSRHWKRLGWAAVLIVSFNLYFRFDTLFINIYFGVGETIAFGLSVQIVGMLRQLTSGIVNGFDAVVARLVHEPAEDKIDRISSLVSFSAYLQALVTGHGVLFLTLTLPTLLVFWVGDRVSDLTILSATTQLSLILAFGMAARSFSEIWMNQLQGQGKLDAFVRYTAVITLFNPFIVIFIATLNPGGITLLQVGIIYTLLLSISHLIIVPGIYIRENGGSWLGMYRVVFRGLASVPVGALAVYGIGIMMEFNNDLNRLIVVGSILFVIALIDLFFFMLHNIRAGRY